MNEKVLKRIFKLKLELAEMMLEALPAPLKEQVRERERQVLQVMHDLSEEFLARGNEDKDKVTSGGNKSQAIKTIVVED